MNSKTAAFTSAGLAQSERSISSVSNVAKKLSASALSKQSPTETIDGAIPEFAELPAERPGSCTATRGRNGGRARHLDGDGRRPCRAPPSRSSTRMWLARLQPTTRRLQASVTAER